MSVKFIFFSTFFDRGQVMLVECRNALIKYLFRRKMEIQVCTPVLSMKSA